MEVKRTFDILQNLLQEFPDKEVILAEKQHNKWRKYSTQEYVNTVNQISVALIALGVDVGDKIATIANNRPQWNFVDHAITQIGAVHVPIYPTLNEEEYLYIVGHAEAKIVFVADTLILEKIRNIMPHLEELPTIYTFDHIKTAKCWTELLNIGENNFEEYEQELKMRKEAVKEDDMASIIYTSGTTGKPKGVMLSHLNFISNVKATKNLPPVTAEDSVLSFLPLSHVLERMTNYLWQYLGVSIYYAESIEQIADNLKEVKPAGFVTVPRLLERTYDKILAKASELPNIKKRIFNWALQLGHNYSENPDKPFLYRKKLEIADKLVFSKWREALGGNIKLIIVGGAALQPRLARVFWAAGIRVAEGYGLTETSPVIAVNHAEYPYFKFGTVGPILEDVKVKIAEDGEILMQGPNLMLGYYKDNERTDKNIDKDGWFHTGDIGEIVEDKFLKITDRKKEIFKLSTGLYITPQAIENLLKESPYIEQLMVVGENQKFVGALICPNFELLHDWANEHKLQYRDNLDLIKNPDVIDFYDNEIAKYNRRLNKTQKIKRAAIVCEEWTPANGELSPTLKLRRRFIFEKYRQRIMEIYPNLT